MSSTFLTLVDATCHASVEMPSTAALRAPSFERRAWIRQARRTRDGWTTRHSKEGMSCGGPGMSQKSTLIHPRASVDDTVWAISHCGRVICCSVLPFLCSSKSNNFDGTCSFLLIIMCFRFIHLAPISCVVLSVVLISSKGNVLS
ncbi:hypothetical protein ARMGADRAFT_669695 [Armillaria gallica]|uniref:Uncharacterized protein n=1 Tax=Armillaria gallica TaxID=47427 RepID=A0A2H3CNL1_ARMGA|nr:hypothetical protein ARMGADRAFT_669695 [Armillaria gallica]